MVKKKKNSQKKQIKKLKGGNKKQPEVIPTRSEIQSDNSDSITKIKILIIVISNEKTWAVYFVNSLFNLYNETKKHFETDLMIANSCNIENMRNVGCLSALGKNIDGIKYDYFVELDTDHQYPEDFIIKFMKHNKDFVCGLTNRRKPPYTTTHFIKWKRKNISLPKNCVENKKQGLVEVSASGVVGALIKTSVLENIKFPFFNDIYQENDVLREGIKRRGSDVEFTRKLRQSGIKLYCDTDVSFPHELTVHVDRGEFKPYLG